MIAHHTNLGEKDAERWMTRSIAFGAGPHADFGQAAASAAVMVQHLPLLSPIDEEGLLLDAGFSDITLFYAGFTFRGWVATA